MTRKALATIATMGLLFASASSPAADFTSPVRLMADGKAIRVESPGYACPCWADLDGDGKKDLLVGQFSGGKIMMYKNLGDMKFAKGVFLSVNGKPAEVPGVW
jgi:hypothetical protein